MKSSPALQNLLIDLADQGLESESIEIITKDIRDAEKINAELFLGLLECFLMSISNNNTMPEKTLFILGEEGSGKSLFANYLANKKIKYDENNILIVED